MSLPVEGTEKLKFSSSLFTKTRFKFIEDYKNNEKKKPHGSEMQLSKLNKAANKAWLMSKQRAALVQSMSAAERKRRRIA